jgi:methyl-accepting chemotaxis protein
MVTDAGGRIPVVVDRVRVAPKLIQTTTQSTVEQSSGTSRVSAAVAQLKRDTHQNAALAA